MVYRVYSEKKKEFANEAKGLLSELRNLLGITSLTDVRILNRYDAENITAELFEYAKKTVFSEPQVDMVCEEAVLEDATVFAVEFLPGQFDQRADSAAQCIQIISRGDRPLVRSAKVYALYGFLTEDKVSEIKKYVINPVEAREAALEKPETLVVQYDIPTEVKTLEGFTKLDEAGLQQFIGDYGLAMDLGDIRFCQEYFLSEHRDPTITEIRMIDTYWSDHCRHTTFGTIIDKVKLSDPALEASYQRYLDTRKALGRTKPVCLMDIATLAVKYLKKNGMLDKLDESEEINACTVKIEVEADGVKEPWLLLFKNETHNHPTEIEPFGGAATCVGGAIRDPLSGRSYVYGAMRVTGAADPRRPISETLPGKLPQRKIVTTAAAGYASYGNQIGLATGIVDELYHPGYVAKRMEIGAVIAAAPACNVRREAPVPGDVVILLGGSTGRDGIGGATGSSKAHTTHSVETCGAEVQKGNAPEERKLQRLFRSEKASRMIKRCNDFGAGGVSVAIGELAPGLDIDLNAVPRKYEGLDGTELAISESQERMAVVVEAKDEAAFLALADAENLQAVRVAVVKEDPRLTMEWNGKKIVDISRKFLDSNGAEKHIEIETPVLKEAPVRDYPTFLSGMKAIASDLNCCSRRGLSERFDSTIGAGSVLMPFGGKNQQTPVQAMVQKISMEEKHTDDCSLMAYGFNPALMESSPYHGAYLAVVESVSKLVATGAEFKDVYLSFQEYFEKPGRDPRRWGKPFSALLGAFDAQMDLGIGAIGGKDSMSGTFEKIDVPPTLVSFAVTTQKTGDIVSPEFKAAGHYVALMEPERDEKGLPDADSLKELYDYITELQRCGVAVACYTPGTGGVAEAVMKMAFGNGIGVAFNDSVELEDLFSLRYGSFVVELTHDLIPGMTIGETTDDGKISFDGISIGLEELQAIYEGVLEDIYPCNIKAAAVPMETISFSAEAADRVTYQSCTAQDGAVQSKGASGAGSVLHCGDTSVASGYGSVVASGNESAFVCGARPRVLIPVFPGTNCEYDSAKAVRDAGADAEIFVIRNRSSEDISRSVDEFADRLRTAQMVFIPGGFSGGDEPDGSGKFITSFFRNAAVKEGVTSLLDERGGLVCGICNGFQALIKLGLVPYGKIIDTDENCPTLSFNDIARHQSRIVRTRIASNKSPWLAHCQVGEVYNVPISHGEGKFIASEELVRQLMANGQIATQYVDFDGNAAADIHFNPNGSTFAIEGITSPDGRVFGKMGHAERWNAGLYLNVPGNYDIGMFRSAVSFFR